MARCQGETKAGNQCKRTATVGDFCRSHKPDDFSDDTVSDSQQTGEWRPKEMDSNGLMTQAAFSRLLQVTDATVRQYHQRGIIEKTPCGKIDVAQALAGLKKRGGDLRSSSTRRSLIAKGSGADTVVEEYEPTKDKPSNSDPGDLQTQKLRAQVDGLIHKARLHEMKADQQAGRLVEIDAVDRRMFGVYRVVRSQMFTIADRVSSGLAGLTSPTEIHARLTDEIREVLTELANEIENMDFSEDG